MAEVIGIIGDRGAGKTCLMTALLYIDYNLKKPIIANYHLKFPVKYMSFEQIASLPEELTHATLGFDELGVGADSRQFFKKRNTNLGKLITQLRKRKCLLYYTVQRLNLIDKRIREQTDKFFIMEKTDTEGHFDLIILNGTTRDLEMKTRFKGYKFFNLYDTNEIIDLGGE